MTVSILVGDARDRLRDIPTGSVQMCVTSPPYWGLRSYLPVSHPDKPREIGLEPTLDQWVRTTVDVFSEVHRVLRPDGTLWLNLGDSYAGTRDPKGKHSNYITGKKPNMSAEAQQYMIESRRRDKHVIPRSDKKSYGFKNKDMHGQPWRAAFALQGFATISCMTLGEWADTLQAARAAGDWAMVELVEQRIRAWDFTEAMKHKGWVLRQEIIWSKANPMPESMGDRCTKAHEHLFLFAKQRYYFFDAEAISEPVSPNTHPRLARGRAADHKHAQAVVPGATAQGILAARPNRTGNTPSGWAMTQDERANWEGRARSERLGRAPGWRKGNGVGFGHGYDEEPKGRVKNNASMDAALAVMPDKRNKRSVWTFPTEGFRGAHFATFPQALVEPCVLAGSRIGDWVLDPFAGSGTTGLVCELNCRNSVLIDLDERNDSMAKTRILEGAPLTTEIVDHVDALRSPEAPVDATPPGGQLEPPREGSPADLAEASAVNSACPT